MDSVNFIKNPSRWLAGGGFLCPSSGIAAMYGRRSAS